MTLKIDDLVVAVIVKWQLCGLHKVSIIGYEHYDGLLIPARGTINKWSPIRYEGLKVRARVLRVDRYYLDLVEII